METRIPPGWRPVADHSAANPERTPGNAVRLLARGSRLAWLRTDGTLSDGRHEDEDAFEQDMALLSGMTTGQREIIRGIAREGEGEEG